MFVDLDRPYGVYMDELLGKIDVKKTREACIKRKENNLYEREEFRDVLINNQKICNLVTEMDIRKRFTDYDPDKPAQQRANLLNRYIEAQMNSVNKTYRLCVDAGEDILKAALETLMKLGRYYDAKSILRTCIAAGVIDAGDTLAKHMTDQADRCADMMEAAFRYGDREKAMRLLKEANDLAGTKPYEAVRY
jgi:hypothetical protein